MLLAAIERKENAHAALADKEDLVAGLAAVKDGRARGHGELAQDGAQRVRLAAVKLSEKLDFLEIERHSRDGRNQIGLGQEEIFDPLERGIELSEDADEPFGLRSHLSEIGLKSWPRRILQLTQQATAASAGGDPRFA